MYRGQIIDTHMHLWDVSNGYEWLPDFANGALNKNFLMPDYLSMAERQCVSGTVHIECGGFPGNPARETEWVQRQADRYGGPQAIIGFAKLDSPDLEQTLKDHCQYPNFRGIRMPLNKIGSFGADRDDYMSDKAWRKGYSLLSKYRLHFEMQIYDTQIPEAAILAKTYPDIPIVLQHLGWPVETGPGYLKEWAKRLEALAAQPNVLLKLSCLGWVFQKKGDPLPYLQEALRLFGPGRCIVGSNCPPDEIFISFDEIFRLLKTALASYTSNEQQQVFYGNAKKFYRI